ncbi:POLQ [Cordylochernes scorpioides]|uniref:POLQ n=1 Tax=Cordylochernes scorpioides TaxID=51811 RepID=A0ABY6KPD3_9ARAC|nr:POLQ [Cordylochernes scorpioides]
MVTDLLWDNLRHGTEDSGGPAGSDGDRSPAVYVLLQVCLPHCANLCPASQRFLRATVNQCRSQGYVETIRGRRRPLPGLSSANAAVRSAAERQAINTLVQGSAADLVKLATVAAQRSMDSLLATRPGLHANLVLQLHDELLWEVSQEISQHLATALRRAMENALPLTVHLPVNLRMGPSWGQLRKIQT